MIFILIVMPIFGFFFFARLNNINTSLAQKKSSDLITLNTLANTLDTYKDSVEAVGNIISGDKEVREYITQASRAAEDRGKVSYKQMDNRPCLKRYENTLDSILAVSLMDADGYFIGEQTLNLDRLTYFFNRTAMNKIRESPNRWTKTFSIQYKDSGERKRVFSYLVPVNDQTDRMIGYVVLFTDTGKMNELLQAYSDDIYILEEEYIIASQKELPMYTSLFSEMQISYGLLLEDSSVIIKQEEDSLIVTTRSFPPFDIQLLLISSYQVLKNEVTTTFPTLMTFTVYGILFAIFSAMAIAGVQTKPIMSLKNVMNHAKGGDLSVRFTPNSKDEIAELGITFNSLLDRIQVLMREQKNHQKLKRKMELQMIQEQVKPHFLYNVLEMINSMIRCNMGQEAMNTVESLANFYRISLNNGSGIIRIAQEIQLIENYLSLQKMRYIEFMDYVLAFSPAVYDYTIPKLTLQPLVENAIYHGIKEKGSKGTVCVGGYLENHRVVFEVLDTGSGMTEEKKEEIYEAIREERDERDQHFGLASVVKRLNIHYNDQVEFHIESRAGEYTCIVISFPATKKETGEERGDIYA
ncbi:sensor histidine kinase [Diplocloster hominis]|uniref:sensor histidine kinase n=1 Tax=Diplocloster hominis TaxID=3079010 RepID=UPI0031BAC833